MQKSVTEKLNEDIENLFYDVLCGELEKTIIEEKFNVSSLISILMETNYVEFKRARDRYKQNNKTFKKVAK